jgi:hypothetical protein
MTTPVEISVIINSLKSDSASGCDYTSTKFCKRAILCLSDVISRLINEWFILGCLKLARVIPIFKSGSRLEMNNHRPISIRFFSKVFEYALHSRIQDCFSFIKVNSALYNCSFFHRFYVIHSGEAGSGFICGESIY